MNNFNLICFADLNVNNPPNIICSASITMVKLLHYPNAAQTVDLISKFHNLIYKSEIIYEFK